ncbi:hypothetical protein ABZ307_35790 [Streptomyces griseorubiginosus]|uniref:hypothetical protein n=1 Tax=Streptomyces griseorubiginosus TaxID=67304 RepID=UPI0033AA31BC
MARSAYGVSRMRSPSAAAAVWAVLLAAVITLLGPAALGGGECSTGSGPGLAAGAGAGPAYGEPYADTADPALTTPAVRGQGEVAGERHTAPAAVQGATPGAGTPPTRPAPPAVTAKGPPVSADSAPRHGVRAPPSLSGI